MDSIIEVRWVQYAGLPQSGDQRLLQYRTRQFSLIEGRVGEVRFSDSWSEWRDVPVTAGG